MTSAEEHSVPCVSPSAVTFQEPLDGNDTNTKHFSNLDWTIQREISITIDKSVNESKKIFSNKFQIFFTIVISIAFILSIILPIIVLLVDPYWPPPIQTGSTGRTTTSASNFSKHALNLYRCEDFISFENVTFNGYDLFSNNSMTWSTCCSWCHEVSPCRAFTFDQDVSICYLKTKASENVTFQPSCYSAKYP